MAPTVHNAPIPTHAPAMTSLSQCEDRITIVPATMTTIEVAVIVQ
jgi:hypothetical protein